MERVRREPPQFRRVEVRRVAQVSPRMRRVTMAGPELDGFALDEPAASVRLLLPSPSSSSGRSLVMPTWNGNEFLQPDGTRPPIRTFTPRRFDPTTRELDVDVVLHGNGPASDWARTAAPGDAVAVSGPGRGYAVDVDAPAYLLVGDESALPAINQLLDAIPAAVPVRALVEVAAPEARLAPLSVEWLDLPPGAAPGEAMVAAVRDAELVDGVRVWAAGEAAAVQRIRRHLFEERGMPRTHASVRGYWKRDRSPLDRISTGTVPVEMS
jgi:NADPH-dependent ferric siderophore reductase